MQRVFLVIIFVKLVIAGSGDEVSDFQRCKLATFLSIVDANNDGIVEESDYHLLADRFLNACNWKMDGNKTLAIHGTAVGKAWKSFPLDKNGEAKSVTHDEFWAVMPTRSKDPKYKDKLMNTFQITFSVYDVDQDGLLSLIEHSAKLHQYRGIDSATTKPYFDAIDTNHDGVLTYDEYSAAYYDFLTGEDETSPSKFFFGPLV